MSKIAADRIRSIVKKTVRETIREELLKLYILMAPEITTKEQKELEKIYKKPSKKQYNKFVDMTDWVGK